MIDETAFTPAWKLAELIRNKKLSPVEITEIYLERIDKLNPKLHAFLAVDYDNARKQAKKAEEAVFKEEDLPPLHGIPISIKDLTNTKGIRTTYGSLIYKDNIPKEDDIVVERLKKAGTIILGKTNTPEFGKSGLTHNRLGEHCRTPWDVARKSAGSSGGAAKLPHALTCPFNLTGQPVATVPCGFSANGLPIGLQIIGRVGDEMTVLKASAAFEMERPWADKIPPVCREIS